jgi:hypothetical protein
MPKNPKRKRGLSISEEATVSIQHCCCESCKGNPSPNLVISIFHPCLYECEPGGELVPFSIVDRQQAREMIQHIQALLLTPHGG